MCFLADDGDVEVGGNCEISKCSREIVALCIQGIWSSCCKASSEIFGLGLGRDCGGIGIQKRIWSSCFPSLMIRKFWIRVGEGLLWHWDSKNLELLFCKHHDQKGLG